MLSNYECLGFTVLLCITCIFLWYFNRYRYWKRKKVKGPKPTLIFGNILELFTKRHSLGVQFQKLYENTKHLPYAGIYLLHRPALLVNNLNLMNFILVRDFEHFTDHGLVFGAENRPLVQHLYNLDGAHWEKMRNSLTLAFTPNKIKQMFGTILGCGSKIAEHLRNDALIGCPVDITEVLEKFTTDVILSCVFGVESNSFENPDTKFKKMSRSIFEFGLKKKIILYTSLFAPDVQKIVNAKIFNDDVNIFFTEFIDDILTYRKMNNISKNDIMDILIQLKDENTRDIKLTQIQLTAIAFGFFVDGFETASSTCSFMFYELAKNQNIQIKLREEIESVLLKHDGEVTYESLNKMVYMAQVIDETLRKYPPIPQLFRICTKDYVIPYTKVLIEKGTPVFMSALGVHNDPKIYPNPENFDPERFSPSNKAKLKDHSFLSFGDGPRMCIGNKFVTMQIKVAVVSLIRNYSIELANNNCFSMRNDTLLLIPKEINLKVSFVSTL